MSSPTVWETISPSARKLMEDLYLRLGVLQIQEQVCERLLTTEERQELLPGGSSESFIKAWMRLRKVSQPRAMIDMGRGIGFLSEADANWLLREFRETSDTPSRQPQDSAAKPMWNSVTLELHLGAERIKKVRGKKIAKNVVMILDGFEELGWPERIDSPFSGSAEGKETLRDTIKSLNSALTHIRFHSDGSGEGILWERCSP